MPVNIFGLPSNSFGFGANNDFSYSAGGGGAYVPGEEPSRLGTDTAQSNINAAPYDVQVADLVNATNRAAQQASNTSRIPGEAGLEAISSENIKRNLQGLVDPTTEAMLQQGIAESGYGRGFGVDTPALSAAYRRALGLDINALEQQGQANLSAAVARNPGAPIYDVSRQLVTPGEYASLSENQAARQQQANLAQMAIAERNARGPVTGTGGGGGRILSPAEYNAAPAAPAFGGDVGGGAGAPTATATTNLFSTDSYDSVFNYNPTGSSIFGSAGTGTATYDMFDPLGTLPQFGGMPDYGGFQTQPTGAPLATYQPTSTDFSSLLSTAGQSIGDYASAGGADLGPSVGGSAYTDYEGLYPWEEEYF